MHSGFGEDANWDDQVEGPLGAWTYFVWNDALLFIEIEGGAPSGFHAGFWLSTYGLPNDAVAAL